VQYGKLCPLPMVVVLVLRADMLADVQQQSYSILMSGARRRRE
jgi:hypothetical protein